MTNEELLIECKKGLNIAIATTVFDSVLNQKILIVKSYMMGAGVSNDMMGDDLAVGIIVTGVSDIWNLSGGEIKFSSLFHMLLSQLAIKSGTFILKSSTPVEGATGISVDINPILTFNNRVGSYTIHIVPSNNPDSFISGNINLDVTGKILTIVPESLLQAATKYAIVISSITDNIGQKIEYLVIQFTTI